MKIDINITGTAPYEYTTITPSCITGWYDINDVFTSSNTIDSNAVAIEINCDVTITATDSNGCTKDATYLCPSGCTDSTAINYDLTATCDDGSCTYCVDPILTLNLPESFCRILTDNSSVDLNQYTNLPGGVWTASVSTGLTSTGILTPAAYTVVTPNNNSLLLTITYTYTDENGCEWTITDTTTIFYGGCTDPAACNYNANASCDDGSCVYPGCDSVLLDITTGPSQFTLNNITSSCDLITSYIIEVYSYINGDRTQVLTLTSTEIGNTFPVPSGTMDFDIIINGQTAFTQCQEIQINPYQCTDTINVNQNTTLDTLGDNNNPADSKIQYIEILPETDTDAISFIFDADDAVDCVVICQTIGGIEQEIYSLCQGNVLPSQGCYPYPIDCSETTIGANASVDQGNNISTDEVTHTMELLDDSLITFKIYSNNESTTWKLNNVDCCTYSECLTTQELLDSISFTCDSTQINHANIVRTQPTICGGSYSVSRPLYKREICRSQSILSDSYTCDTGNEVEFEVVDNNDGTINLIFDTPANALNSYNSLTQTLSGFYCNDGVYEDRRAVFTTCSNISVVDFNVCLSNTQINNNILTIELNDTVRSCSGSPIPSSYIVGVYNLLHLRIYRYAINPEINIVNNAVFDFKEFIGYSNTSIDCGYENVEVRFKLYHPDNGALSNLSDCVCFGWYSEYTTDGGITWNYNTNFNGDLELDHLLLYNDNTVTCL